jgi:protein phosphatase 1L
MSRENLSSTTPAIFSSPASLFDMQWTVIFSIIFILFVLIRFLNAVFSRRAAKVVCSLGNAASVVSIQGARSYQEDKYVAKLSYRDDPHCAFFGVFDGHGGAKASDYLSQQLHLNVQRELQHNADVGEALRYVYRPFIALCSLNPSLFCTCVL